MTVLAGGNPSSSRIVYLLPELPHVPGGIQRHTDLVLRALEELSTPVDLLSLHGSMQDVARPSVAGRVRPARPQRAGLQRTAFGGNRTRFVLSSLLSARRRPALILVEHVQLAPVGLAAGHLARAPVAVFLHGIESWECLPAFQRFGLQRVDSILAVSRFTAERAIAASRLDPVRVTVLPSCAGEIPEPIDPVEREGRLSLLTVSRLRTSERYKGHAQVIRALPALLSRFPGLEYHIAGDGDGRPALERLAAERGVVHATRFHGEVSEDELNRLYAEADIFVMPSSGEGFGLVFLEAMARGIPVVAGNVDATPEVVTDGETGVLIDPASVEALAAALALLLGDRQLRNRMGAAAALRASTIFDFEGFRQRLGDALAGLGVPVPVVAPVTQDETARAALR